MSKSFSLPQFFLQTQSLPRRQAKTSVITIGKASTWKKTVSQGRGYHSFIGHSAVSLLERSVTLYFLGLNCCFQPCFAKCSTQLFSGMLRVTGYFKMIIIRRTNFIAENPARTSTHYTPKSGLTHNVRGAACHPASTGRSSVMEIKDPSADQDNALQQKSFNSLLHAPSLAPAEDHHLLSQ